MTPTGKSAAALGARRAPSGWKKGDAEQLGVALLLDGALHIRFQHTAYSANAYVECTAGTASRYAAGRGRAVVLDRPAHAKKAVAKRTKKQTQQPKAAGAGTGGSEGIAKRKRKALTEPAAPVAKAARLSLSVDLSDESDDSDFE